MRKIIVISMITLDGVMQAPGGSKEDAAEGFRYGGWTAPYADANRSDFFVKNMQPAEYLLGRTTFEIFAGYWPKHADIWPGINDGMKYVMTGSLEKSDWKNTAFLRSLKDIKKLRNSNGPDLHVWGSGRLIQLLMKNDLVDEYRLATYPLTLGQGKKLFAEGSIPAAFTLTWSSVTPSGVFMAYYRRAGNVRTGNPGD